MNLGKRLFQCILNRQHLAHFLDKIIQILYNMRAGKREDNTWLPRSCSTSTIFFLVSFMISFVIIKSKGKPRFLTNCHDGSIIIINFKLNVA